MKVLLIGTTHVVPLTLESRLKRMEFLTERVTSVQDARALVRDFAQSLVILGLGDSANEEFLAFLRKQEKLTVPVLVLSSEPKHESLLRAFELGCDDYQHSDTEGEVLIARIKALIRRSNGQADNVIEAGAIRINLTTHLVTVEGEKKRISGFSYRLLVLFCLKKRSVLTRDQIINELYTSHSAPSERTIDVKVGRLRRILGEKEYIETVRGDGYRVVEQ